MNSKTPRTAIGEFVNASFTQATKKNNVQSRVRINDETPRSPSFVPTPRKIEAAARLTKSPGRTLNQGRGGKQNSPRSIPSSQRKGASTPKTQRRLANMDDGPKSRDNLLKSPVNQYKELIASVSKGPRHSVRHDRVASLRTTPRITMSQPAEEITPGTMISAFLSATDSTVPFVRQRARTSQTGLSVPAQLKDVKQSAVKSRRRSIGESEKETPRALIQNFLENVNSSQTPAISTHRVQMNNYVSPDLVIPNPSSYHTPNFFQSSSSERSQEGSNGLSVPRKPRRTPRPHAPFQFDLPTRELAESDLQNYVEKDQETVETPSPFKLSTSDASSPFSRYSFQDRSQRFRASQVQRGTISLDIPEHLLNRGDTNNLMEGDDSMDSTKAQAQGDQYLDDEENQQIEHADNEDKENLEDHREVEGMEEEYEIDEDRDGENIDHPVDEETLSRRASNLHRSREYIETDEAPERQQSNYSRNRERSLGENPMAKSSSFQRSNRSRGFIEDPLGPQYMNDSAINKRRSQYESLRPRRSDMTRDIMEGTPYDNSINTQRSFNGSSAAKRANRSRELVAETQSIMYQGNLVSSRRENKSDAEFQRFNRTREFVQETQFDQSGHRSPYGSQVSNRSRSYRKRSFETSNVPDERVEETRYQHEASGGYDEARGDNFDEAAGGYDEAEGNYDEVELDENEERSVRPADMSRKSGMNLSQAVPTSFVPEFTSTQQPALAMQEEADENVEEDENDVQDDEQDEPMEVEENMAAETVPQVKPQKPRKPRKKEKYSLPVSMVKKAYMRFSDKRLSKDALEEVMKVCEVYWDNLIADLMAYAKHAGRKKINMDDFALLFKRQGHTNDKISLDYLITKYLDMEDRRKLIPVARAGNRIELWK